MSLLGGTRVSDVAALYVDPRGPYPKLVEHWYDQKRDARTYAGPWPVVAHPPCGPWGALRHLNRYQDATLAPIAVGQVRLYGGVLEHPVRSGLWDHMGLPRPGELPDEAGGWTVEVSQCDWGHVARKRTWLYFVGVHDLGPMPAPGKPTHWVSGGRVKRGGRGGGVVPPGIKICSTQQRGRSPMAFAAWLINCARLART